MSPLKSTSWLSENIGKVKILDATWHMPNSNRNALKEFQEKSALKVTGSINSETLKALNIEEQEFAE